MSNNKDVAGKDMYGKTLYIGDKVVFYTQESKSYRHGLVKFHLGTITGYTNCFILIKTLNGKVTNRSEAKILKYEWNSKNIKEEL